ncbi:MAG: hypothetical protein ACYDCL_12085 [Myxococcales bacterium]
MFGMRAAGSWVAALSVCAAACHPVATATSDGGADAGTQDSGFDSGAPDAGEDAGVDAGAQGGADAGSKDGGADAGAPTAFVSFDTSLTTPVPPGFSGFNTYLVNAISYRDTAFQAMAAGLHPGWLRFPAGTDDDVFDWTTGLAPLAWVDEFDGGNGPYVTMLSTHELLAGLGGERLSDFAAMASATGAKGIVVCVNGFTDTPQSAGELAAYVADAGLPVVAFELSNEPYLFPTWWANADAYAAAMKPYHDAIATELPDAGISLFLAPGAGSSGTAWNGALADGEQYWNMVSYHDYPGVGGAMAFDQKMASLNGHLGQIAGFLGGLGTQIGLRPGTPILVTESDPGGVKDGVAGTLYGGVYEAEYALRLSTVPAVRLVGQHALSGANGIDYADDHVADVLAAADAGQVLDTSGLDFGYFDAAQATAFGVANEALIHATMADATSLDGGSEVPSGNETMPALYAQVYEGDDGDRHLVVTNKGAASEVVLVLHGGKPVAATFDESLTTGPAPDSVNAPDAGVVARMVLTSDNPVSVPPYSVVHLSWHP